MELPPFWVYVLISIRDNNFYIGTTNNLPRRLRQHASGQNASTRKRRPFKLLYCEGHTSISDARRRELYFKTTKGRAMLKYIIRDTLSKSVQR